MKSKANLASFLVLMAVVPTIYSLKIETNSLILHDESGRPRKVLEFPSPVTSGSSSAVTPFGIVVTGPTVASSRSAFLWNGATVVQLPELNSDHICHGSVYFKGKVMVIGGLNTAVVETFEHGASQWDFGVDMMSPKANFALVVVRDMLYLLGGVGINGRYHDSILTFDGNSWGKLSLKIPKKMRGSGAFAVSETAIVVFGGRVENAEAKRVENTELWMVDVGSNQVSVCGTLPTPGLFSAFQCVDTPTCVAATSDTSKMLLWVKAERRFEVVSQ